MINTLSVNKISRTIYEKLLEKWKVCHLVKKIKLNRYEKSRFLQFVVKKIIQRGCDSESIIK